ncbi:alpha/beta-hydrolase [Lipomyces starkeyi]
MTSNPFAHCLVGVKHEGTAAGEIRTVGGIESYIIHPKDGNTANAIIILSDVIGHKFINAQLIADQFAANGYLTIMPDLFHGDPVLLNPPEDFDIMEWLTKGSDNKGGHPPEIVDPVIESVINAMRDVMGVKRIGAVGYCFGGKYVCRFLKPGFVDVGFTAHPSFIEPDELRAIMGPLSIAAAETDEIFPAPKRHESEEILARHQMNVPYQVTLYSGVVHGFAVRANITDISSKAAKFAKEAAFYQAVNWFNTFLKG